MMIHFCSDAPKCQQRRGGGKADQGEQNPGQNKSMMESQNIQSHEHIIIICASAVQHYSEVAISKQFFPLRRKLPIFGAICQI